ncbi:unnamed protein product [Schistosoma margrebowiei]|uniref:Uncharacterized protein n=1 Tax=Schistosoma margrebowiei TaxID=48269 RepID=A0A183MCW9_9TREM|nr:unnamed protein product [Schistosoma margrebowiei]
MSSSILREQMANEPIVGHRLPWDCISSRCSTALWIRPSGRRLGTFEEVRKATKELVLAWFNGTNRDPVLLLRRLDPEGDPSTSQKALDSLFEMLPLDDLLKVVQEWSPNYLNSE